MCVPLCRGRSWETVPSWAVSWTGQLCLGHWRSHPVLQPVSNEPSSRGGDDVLDALAGFASAHDGVGRADRWPNLWCDYRIICLSGSQALEASSAGAVMLDFRQIVLHGDPKCVRGAHTHNPIQGPVAESVVRIFT